MGGGIVQSSSISSAADIGARIREARLAQRMSQAELAEKSNISLPHISEIELGKADIRLQGFIRIIEALQVSSDVILKANVPAVSQLLVQEYADLLSDCTPEEIQALITITKQLKTTMRTHKTEE